MDEPYGWRESRWELGRGYLPPPAPRFKVVAYDSGSSRTSCATSPRWAASWTWCRPRRRRPPSSSGSPMASFSRTGPGIQKACPVPRSSPSRGLIGKAPIFGICLGNQILGLAFGGATYKLKFGHHGANHPVRDLLARTSRDHVAEPRVRRRSQIRGPRRPRGDPRQSQRRHVRGHAASGAADLLRPVPSRRPRPVLTTRTTCSIASSTCWRRVTVARSRAAVRRIRHDTLDRSPTSGCSASSAGFARAVESWGEVRKGGEAPPPSSHERRLIRCRST